MSKQEQDALIESLVFGDYNPSLKEEYFQALKENEATYNQMVSDAALYFAEELEKEHDTEKALLAYAYAYYHDPENEHIPNAALRQLLSAPNPSGIPKQVFIRQLMKRDI